MPWNGLARKHSQHCRPYLSWLTKKKQDSWKAMGLLASWRSFLDNFILMSSVICFLNPFSCVQQVHDAGHMVPMDQPKVALEMLKRWMQGKLAEDSPQPSDLAADMWWPDQAACFTWFVRCFHWGKYVVVAIAIKKMMPVNICASS